MTQKVVYNSCYGGFSVHEDLIKWMREQGDKEAEEATISGEYYPDGSGPKREHHSGVRDISRDNELLAEAVQGNTEYGGRVSGKHASLRVAEVPDGVEWVIDEYDGVETVKEKSRTFS